MVRASIINDAPIIIDARAIFGAGSLISISFYDFEKADEKIKTTDSRRRQ